MCFGSHDTPCGLYNSLSTLQASRSAPAFGQHCVYAMKNTKRYLLARKTRYRRVANPYRIKTSSAFSSTCLGGQAAEVTGHSIRRRQALLDVPTCAASALNAGNLPLNKSKKTCQDRAFLPDAAAMRAVVCCKLACYFNVYAAAI